AGLAASRFTLPFACYIRHPPPFSFWSLHLFHNKISPLGSRRDFVDGLSLPGFAGQALFGFFTESSEKPYERGFALCGARQGLSDRPWTLREHVFLDWYWVKYR
ncbi:MAG: hypothetical protein IKS31_03165, partial [Clostridia bacterium]|nr:hypothetical protein [Clostridia bacterium]